MSIVVAYIPTREGRAALRRATTECETRRSTLVVVHTRAAGRTFDADTMRSLEDELDRTRVRLEAAGLGIEVRRRDGGVDSAEELIAVAEEREAEMIVIGLRRRTPVGKLILGSSSQRILLDASCPVLAVKAGADDE